MIANHMHVYSVVLPGMFVHKLLTELLLDVAVTICLSMLAYQGKPLPVLSPHVWRDTFVAKPRMLVIPARQSALMSGSC